MKPPRLGILGAGGFGVNVADCVLQHRGGLQTAVELVVVAEPDAVTNAQRLARLRSCGVMTVPSFEELLAGDDIEVVWLPVPTALQRPFTEKAMLAGRAVLGEKSAAGCVQDVDVMIAARDLAQLPEVVGFQHAFESLVATLKRCLSEIGPIQSAAVYGCWPRGAAYFGCNNWAGGFLASGTWVADSPIQNALAHFLHLAMFILDAAPTEFEAGLYRAKSIASKDLRGFRAFNGPAVQGAA